MSRSSGAKTAGRIACWWGRARTGYCRDVVAGRLALRARARQIDSFRCSRIESGTTGVVGMGMANQFFALGVVVGMVVGTIGCADHLGSDPSLRDGDVADGGNEWSLLPLGPDGKPLRDADVASDRDGDVADGGVELDGALVDVDAGDGSTALQDDAAVNADGGGAADPDSGVKPNKCGGLQTILCPHPWEGDTENPQSNCTPDKLCASSLLFPTCPAGCRVLSSANTYWRCDSSDSVVCDACDCSGVP